MIFFINFFSKRFHFLRKYLRKRGKGETGPIARGPVGLRYKTQVVPAVLAVLARRSRGARVVLAWC